jgi:hypothetical protein
MLASRNYVGRHQGIMHARLLFTFSNGMPVGPLVALQNIYRGFDYGDTVTETSQISLLRSLVKFYSNSININYSSVIFGYVIPHKNCFIY